MCSRLVLFLLAVLALPVHAQIYKWVDERGAVHDSNGAPPEGVNTKVVGAVARGGFLSGPGLPLAEGAKAEGAKPLPESAAVRPEVRPEPPREPRGLDFRKYIALQRGMSEGELVGIAGEPDLHWRDRSFSTYTYMPTSVDPFTTTINLVRGRISDIERVRRF